MSDAFRVQTVSLQLKCSPHLLLVFCKISRCHLSHCIVMRLLKRRREAKCGTNSPLCQWSYALTQSHETQNENPEEKKNKKANWTKTAATPAMNYKLRVGVWRLLDDSSGTSAAEQTFSLEVAFLWKQLLVCQRPLCVSAVSAPPVSVRRDPDARVHTRTHASGKRTHCKPG